MKERQVAALVACMTLLAMPVTPSATADPCFVPSNDWFGFPTCQLKWATGPGGLQVKGVGAVSFVYCFQDPTFPFSPCAPNPGGINSMGGSIIHVDDNPNSIGDWNTHPNYDPSFVGAHAGRDVRIWVEWIQGIDMEGFGAMVCSDKNDDLTCTGDEETMTTWAWEDPNDDCKEDSGRKDLKKCDSGVELEMYVCIERDNYDYLLVHEDGTITTEHDGDFDDFYVFIRSWADEVFIFSNPQDNTGFGASVGDFNIYLEYGNFLNEDACTLQNQSAGNNEVAIDPPGPIPPRIRVPA